MAKAKTIAAKTTKGNGAKNAAKTAKTAPKSAKPTKTPQNANQTPQTASKTNPYRAGGGYWATVEALRLLGVGKLHAFEKVVPAVKKAMSDAGTWGEFSKRENRNEETGKDTNGRVIQNVSVVGRKDYGAPLRELGFEVKFDGREKVAGLFRTK